MPQHIEIMYQLNAQQLCIDLEGWINQGIEIVSVVAVSVLREINMDDIAVADWLIVYKKEGG